MKKRYERNMAALTRQDIALLNNSKVCVVGCGGLGGYVIEHLSRLGIGMITAVDGDSFEESNLNRQLLSDESVLGENKAVQAKARVGKVNSEVIVNAVAERITAENSEEVLVGHNIIIDALDNIETRRIIEKTAQNLKTPLVHGAIAGWFGQVAVIMPGASVYDKIYPVREHAGIEKEQGVLPFTAAVTASVQAAEAVKVLTGKPSELTGKLLTIDLLSCQFESIVL
jgi:molybdopterin/thiamine biosynthesis adenylyltransferase